ncbi:hypothetical protein OS493_011260 [Desmophyllum pertusum]|uniref:Uncharacterized protein n=1 Tax=Desmophyllum pertusum TaxID=174260 RepID=A0A9W9Z1U9_9CNID|nr:hypothetical protein OS493_011260 [Desmophyllum pertusum]
MLKFEDGKQYRIRSMDRQKFLVWTESNGVTCTGTGNEDSSIITAHRDVVNVPTGIGWHFVFSGTDKTVKKDFALHVQPNGTATSQKFITKTLETAYVPHYLPQSQSSGPQPTTQSVILKLGTSISTPTQQCIAAAPDGSLSLKDVDHANPHLDTVLSYIKPPHLNLNPHLLPRCLN